MEVSKKQIKLRLSARNQERLEEMSERYGMSLNSLVAYILGSWLDSNYDMKERTANILKEGSQQAAEKMLADPSALEMMFKLFSEVSGDEEKK